MLSCFELRRIAMTAFSALPAAPFIAQWRDNPLSERAGAQAFFLDLCTLLGVAAPNDPENYCFERGATRTGAGHGWADVPADNNGLYQRTTKLPKGTFDGSAYTYWDLAENYIDRNGYVRYWNDEAKVPWLYNAVDRIFITYEDPESIGYKMAYIRDHHLGGAMIWNLSSDDGSLLRAVFEGLGIRD